MKEQLSETNGLWPHGEIWTNVTIQMACFGKYF